MPPILSPPMPAPAAQAVQAAPPPAAAVTPSAEAVLPPALPPVAAVTTPPKPAAKPSAAKPHIAAAKPAPVIHHHAKFAALMKRLSNTPHPQPVTHHVAVAGPAPMPAMPPGAVMPPPPGYYGPRPVPYERLVYGGPPVGGPYGGWGGYRGRFPY